MVFSVMSNVMIYAPQPTSIEAALAINDRSPYLTMYYQDGMTPIGTFRMQ